MQESWGPRGLNQALGRYRTGNTSGSDSLEGSSKRSLNRIMEVPSKVQRRPQNLEDAKTWDILQGKP